MARRRPKSASSRWWLQQQWRSKQLVIFMKWLRCNTEYSYIYASGILGIIVLEHWLIRARDFLSSVASTALS